MILSSLDRWGNWNQRLFFFYVPEITLLLVISRVARMKMNAKSGFRAGVFNISYYPITEKKLKIL
jgi:hypothetical protein